MFVQRSVLKEVTGIVDGFVEKSCECCGALDGVVAALT